MKDETTKNMYETAKAKLAELMKQEEQIKQQIAIWAPIAQHLAAACGEHIEVETANRASQAGHDLGLTDAIRFVFKQPLSYPLSPTVVRDQLVSIGYDLSKYAHVMPPIHNTLKRLEAAGEIEEVDSASGRAYVLSGKKKK